MSRWENFPLSKQLLDDMNLISSTINNDSM